MAENDRDLTPAIAAIGGGIAIAAGIYFFTRKPKGVDPGDSVVAVFKFNYSGDGGDYVLQVGLGKIVGLLVWDAFDNVDGLRFPETIYLPPTDGIPTPQEFELEFTIPEGTEAKTYDAEALIRTPTMDVDDYIIRTRMEGALVVRES